MAVLSYRELDVWKKAMDLVEGCYGLTQGFPKTENYGLSSQLQRAAVSVPSNIAEGQAREHTGEFCQFLSIAQGSLAELETHIAIAERLGYAASHDCERLLSQASEVGRMLVGLRKALKSRPAPR
mgnify:FL=1